MKNGAVVVKVSKIADSMGKMSRERRLPNGAVVKQIIWESSDLSGVWKRAAHLARSAQHVIIDGAAPAWLVACIAHAVHPASVSLVDPKVTGGTVPVYTPRPFGSGSLLEYEIRDCGEFVIVEFEIPGGILDPTHLPYIVPPRIKGDRGVVLSGRGPNWLTVSLAMGYAHSVSWVGLYQPGLGSTVAISHSTTRKLGEVVEIRDKAGSGTEEEI